MASVGIIAIARMKNQVFPAKETLEGGSKKFTFLCPLQRGGEQGKIWELTGTDIAQDAGCSGLSRRMSMR